ncbi:hypothetical protein [Sphingobacterium sp. LRF_L2]|uniref:hypothetical protein n=1 Tax=Sphingobacterium sp. LRF_L2 TaxID=3369421 RepID=UPI003F5D90FD
MNILISGLNNYVGRRSVSLMADEHFQVFAVTRNLKLFQRRLFEPSRAEVFELDLIKGEEGDPLPLPELSAAYYFTQVPTLADIVNLKLELLCLRNFIRIVKKRQCVRIIYVARLTDKTCIEPVLELLEEFGMEYTVVLKESVVGRDALIDRVFKSMASQSVIFYASYYSDHRFQPFGVHDFIRWLKQVLHIRAFKNRILEIGGDEGFSFREMFELYKKLGLIEKSQRIMRLSRWMVRVLYQRSLDISSSDYAELSRLMQSGQQSSNSWQSEMPFEFTPLSQILLSDR